MSLDPVKLVFCAAIIAPALLVAACGHQGMTEGEVRAQVKRFMDMPGAPLKLTGVPSCTKTDRKNEWRCKVNESMRTTGERVVLTVITACDGNTCEIATNDYGTSETPWKRLIDDWYADGRINHRYPCAVAQAAVDHLPTDAPDVGAGIRAYERKVC